MSGITGICNIDGRPVDRALLEQMTNAIVHRGPDGIGYWSDGPVGFGHLMLHTTPESQRETQPLSYAAGSLSLTFDGRVDNRKELRSALGNDRYAPRSDTDAELVLRAYERWGEDCAQHLVGDFAFAVWNGRNRTLFCARDPVGIRAFYYLINGTTFYFGTELPPLLDTPGYERKPNLGMLGEFLCDKITSRQDTLYQGILRLPPGHQLVLKDGRLRITQYFRIDPGKSIRYGSDAEYTEHFFDIFKEAVRCRLRSQAPVSQFVSGGLDSSSILGMTHHLIGEGLFDTEKLAVYSLYSSNRDADERNYLDDVTRMWGDKVHSLSMDNATADPLVDQARQFQDIPNFPNGSVLQPLCNLASRNGSRVTFWGFGGDEWLTGSRAHCADLLLQMKIPTLIRQIRHDLVPFDIPGSRTHAVRDVLRWCLVPLIPHGLKSRIKRRLRWKSPRWINADFARAIRLQDRLLTPSPPPFPTMAQRAIHGLLQRGSAALSFEITDRVDARNGMEGRYPFYDRRLIEFALALPEDQRWRDNQTKYVLRQAMQGLLPDSILQRRSKAEFSHLYQEAIARESAGLEFQSLRLATEGYIDAGVAREMHEQCMRGDPQAMQAMDPVWIIMALENWYRIAFPEAA